MTFPYYIDIFGLHLHPHPLFEMLAYSIGFQLYRLTRGRWNHPVVPTEKNLWIIAGCVVGALVGSKLLTWIDAPLDYWSHRDSIAYWLEGKTIVGGLLGGWIGVEIAKKRVGVTYATGDAYVFPLIIGMAIGRIGCFLSGLSDQTYGVQTSLPWGVDFGDGLRRHPAQLYEILFLLSIACLLLFVIRRPFVNGYPFRFFMFAYLGFRFLVEFVKPRYELILGLSMIQVACLAGLLICGRIFLRSSPYNIHGRESLSHA